MHILCIAAILYYLLEDLFASWSTVNPVMYSIMPYPHCLSAWLVQKLLHPTPIISSVALSYLCTDICLSVYLFVLHFMAFVLGRHLHECLVLLHTLYGFVENALVVKIRVKVGNRARCGGRVCIAR